MKHFKLATLAAATAALVTACGGSDSGFERGKLRETPVALATLTAA